MRHSLLLRLGGVLMAAAWASAAEDPAAAKRSTDELIRALKDRIPHRRLEAAKALAAKGTEALPPLTAALKDRNWHVRRGATDALAAMGTDANDAVPALVEALKDKDAWVRDGAAAALGKIGRGVTAAARALAKAVRDEDPWVREAAISALKSVTTDEKVLLPAAVAALKFPDTGWNVRRHAVDVLHRHGRQYKPAIPALVGMLQSPSEGMWDCTQRAVEVLIELKAADRAVPVLTKMLKSKHRGSPNRACALLGKLGAAARPAIPALKAVAKEHEDKRVRAAAKSALEQIEKADEKK